MLNSFRYSLSKSTFVILLKDQIGITVLDRPEMAFAFGHLCILLYSKYAEFKKFVDARLAKKCPYVLPRYYDKSPVRAAKMVAVASVCTDPIMYQCHHIG